MGLLDITNIQHFQDTLSQNKFVVVKFSADWCGPCKRIQPLYEKSSEREEYSHICFTHIDVDEVRDVCEKYEVEGMPTFILFEDGVESSRFAGASDSKLQELLKKIKII